MKVILFTVMLCSYCSLLFSIRRGFFKEKEGGRKTTQSFWRDKLGKTLILFTLQLEAHRNQPRDYN